MNNSRHVLLMDYYELTMADSYYRQGRADEWGVFDYFFRSVPDKGGYAIFAGLETLLDFVENFKFLPEDIDFLREKNVFSHDFLDYLSNFHFRGEIYAFQEGSVIFPREPVIAVRGPLIDCQILETFLLLTCNHQSLIATKSARICSQTKGKPVFEFGSRRAHGADAAFYGSRAAYIGGIAGTANIKANQAFDIPVIGTMAHSFVQSHDSEYQAFVAYANTYPDNTTLLVDTYDTLLSGIPNAIRVHKEVLAPQGHALKGVRIDSGDLAYLSHKIRNILDEAGLTDTKIIVSNALDEYLIKALDEQDAQIDAYGVGERLITARSEPVFGGVYKITAIEKNGEIIPKIKVSENTAKTTTPAFKQVYRVYDCKGMAIADLVTLRDEVIDTEQPYLLFDPESTWKEKQIENFSIKPLLNLVYKEGKRIQAKESLDAIRAHVTAELDTLWDEVKRLEFPHKYYVDLSKPLWDLKQSMLKSEKLISDK